MDSGITTVAEFLAGHQVATIATNGSSGPWAAAVFYVHHGYILYFQSSASSEHVRNLAYDSRVAVTIQSDRCDWKNIRGIQIRGVCRELPGSRAAFAHRLYLEKFKFLRDLVSSGDPNDREPGTQDEIAVRMALAGTCWYEIESTHLYYIDNSVRFGHREKILPAGDDAS